MDDKRTLRDINVNLRTKKARKASIDIFSIDFLEK